MNLGFLKTRRGQIELFGVNRHRNPCALTLVVSCVLAATLASTQASGIVRAWGSNSDGQRDVPVGLADAVAVAGGGLHSLALKGDGTVAVWGWNLLGETNVTRGLTNAIAIAANFGYSLALRSDGTVVGWGTASNTVPAGLTNVTALAAGVNHALALRRDGSVVQWGEVEMPPATVSNVVGIAAGDGHSLALRADGKVVAWGNNASNQTNVPPSLANVVAVAAGDNHSLALKSDGTITAWGDNTYGQRTVPAGLSNVVAIAAGSAHSLALKRDGAVVAWGRNDFGQAAAPPFLTNVFGISGGLYHSLAAVGDGSPAITVPPMNQTVALDKTVTIRVLAVGNPPLAYQWFHEGVKLAGATTSRLQIFNLQMTNGGAYHVVVSNNLGLATSAPATLTPVPLAPWINVQPSDATNICGDTVKFSVAADGSSTLSYQWTFENVVIPDATNASLTLTGVVTSQAGRYQVTVTNLYGSVTSREMLLVVLAQPPQITSPLTASGTQGRPFTYTITAQHGALFDALGLPPGLTVNPVSGVIAGTLLESGTFETRISVANACGQEAQTLVITVASAAPAITSGATVAGMEEIAIAPYQITATGNPTSFDAANLPTGLSVNKNTGIISGVPVLAGSFTATISASNVWGVGTATLHFNIINTLVGGLRLEDVSYNYHAPYLLEFEFALRDTNGNGIVTQPSLLSAVCMENTHPGTTLVVWPDDEPDLPDATTLITNLVSESGVVIARASGSGGKVIKTYLVLDYTDSISDPVLNGDTNNDGVSDAVEYMVAGAQYFVRQQPAGSQLGVYEFHRDDEDPNQVSALTRDKDALNEAIAGIWTNQVNWFYAGSRCWDAVDAAILALGAANPDEQHFVVFVSDGQDSSSAATVDQVISDAQAGRVRPYCIAYGNNPDMATLTRITSATGGRLFTAQTQADLFQRFAQIAKDVQAQYILRWASLRRDTNEIAPFFLLSYQGHTAAPATWDWSYETNMIEVYTTNLDINVDTNSDPPITNITETIETNELTEISLLWENADIGPYFVSNAVGTVTEGILRLVLDEEVNPTGVSLRASYIPRFIRQLRLHYRPNWPCSASLNSTNVGEMLYGWSLTESNAADGSKWVLLSNPNPQSTAGSLPFPGFGPLLTFRFNDILADPTGAFALMEVDNSIYTGIPAGGQRFVFETNNTDGFVTDYPVLPFGTPVPWLIENGFSSNFQAAETGDADNDGVPTWQEYRANTDPNDPNSRFAVLGLTHDPYGRVQITFSSALNRRYRVESSADLATWQVLQDDITGSGMPTTVTDPRSPAVQTQMHYRVLVW